MPKQKNKKMTAKPDILPTWAHLDDFIYIKIYFLYASFSLQRERTKHKKKARGSATYKKKAG